MSDKNNMSLDDVMGTSKPNVNHIDLTKGGSTTDNNTNKNVETETPARPVARKARPVVTGPIDFETMKDADIDKILPRRQPKPNKEEQDMMSALDMAVAREKEKIAERIDAVIEAQDQEIEDAEARAEDEELERYLNNSDNRSDDYYEEDEEEDTYDEDDLFSNATRINVPIDITTSTPGIDTYSSDIDNKEEETVQDDAPIVEAEPVVVTKSASSVDTMIDKKKEEEIRPVVETHGVQQVVHNKTTEEDFDFIKELGLDDEDEEEASATEAEDSDSKVLEEVKAQIKERVEPIRKSIDISKFTISKKSVSAQKVMKMAVKAHQSVADWILYNAEKPISVSGLSGSEILKLNSNESGRNRLNTFKDIYHIIYNHVIDANKPDFETWMKKTNFVDLEHIYFALYMATFAHSNFVNLECPKCGKIFIKDIKIEDMIKYANDEVKAKAAKILRGDSTTSKKKEYDVDIIQVSNTYAFAVKTPSIWNVVIETASLSDKILEKYSDLVDIISYIDSIYIINESTSELIPIDYKIDPSDQAKSSARRVKAFYEVISSLSSEDYFHLRNAITEYDKNVDDIRYIIPETTCPDCNAIIPANTDITSEALVFTRHQLAAIGNM